MNEHAHRAEYAFSPRHQRWLFAQVCAAHDRLCAEIADTEKILEQSRIVIAQAWRTLREANKGLP